MEPVVCSLSSGLLVLTSVLHENTFPAVVENVSRDGTQQHCPDFLDSYYRSTAFQIFTYTVMFYHPFSPPPFLHDRAVTLPQNGSSIKTYDYRSWINLVAMCGHGGVGHNMPARFTTDTV